MNNEENENIYDEKGRPPITRGQYIWVPDINLGFKNAIVYEVDKVKKTVVYEGGSCKMDDCYPTNPETHDGVPDNTQLMFLHSPSLLHNLKVRFMQQKIYTSTAYILIALNPWQILDDDIYGSEMMEMYHTKPLGQLPPHLFATTERAYRQLAASKHPQSVIVSGDSGSGKTENCKYIIRYLCNIAGRGLGKLEQQIIEANPLLEAFGNANTLRNPNSSRFGKYVEINFDHENKVCGAKISTYLLEKSRIVYQCRRERNFHIFYQFCSACLNDEKMGRKYFIGNVEDFHYLNQSQCYRIEGINDLEEFEHTLSAMRLVGMDKKEISSVLRVLAAILHLGNLTFVTKQGNNQSEAAVIEESKKSNLEAIAMLLECDVFSLEYALTIRTISGGTKRGSVITIPLKEDEAYYARDSLAKQIYGRLFDWIVFRINQGIPHGDRENYIGLLDISGFEYFEKNSFEQFCINFCNEKIQQYFINQMLKQDQDIYIQEGLRWKHVDYVDNREVLELLEKKREGLFAMLEEECLMPKGTDVSFTQKVLFSHIGHPKLTQPRLRPRLTKISNDEGFIVSHFAGEVVYSTEGWLDKNNDMLHQDLVSFLSTEASSFVKEIFLVSPGGVISEVQPVNVARSRFSTTSGKFNLQLSELMTRLMSTRSHFVRCINSNEKQKSLQVDGPYVLQQLKFSGMLEALQIMQSGFPTRCHFDDLYSRYKDYMPPILRTLKPSTFCEALLVALDLDEKEFQMGLSRVFFRSGKLSSMDDLVYGGLTEINQIVSRVSGWLCRKRWKASIMAVISILRFGRIILDVREARKRAEEEAKMRDEAYLAEIRRQEEILRLKQEEERLQKEEEERKRIAEEERKRQEKLKRKEEERLEMERLKQEYEAKKNVEEKCTGLEITLKTLQEQSSKEIKLLETEGETLKIEIEDTRKLVSEKITVANVLQEKNSMIEDQNVKLIKDVNDLEAKLNDLTSRNAKLQEALEAERFFRRQDAAKHSKDKSSLKVRREIELAEIKNTYSENLTQLEKQSREHLAKYREQISLEIEALEVRHREEIQKLKLEQGLLLNFANKPTKEGWLMKQGSGGVKKWKKRWFVLKSSQLSYYNLPNEKLPLNILDISDVRVYKLSNKKITGFEMMFPDKKMRIKTEGNDEADAWMKAIHLAKAAHFTTVDLSANAPSLLTKV